MPSRNIVKEYIPNTFYHVYNRGVEKRLIFLDEQDCHVFLRYIKLYLSSQEFIKNEAFMGNVKPRFINLNLSNEIELISFALMPNHFHLLIKQLSRDGIVKFLRRVSTAYVGCFNRKYKRKGTLFESHYKGIIVPTDEYIQHLSGYIHRNPMKVKYKFDLLQYSSLPYYMGDKSAEWVKPEAVMSYFKSINEYKEFVLGDKIDIDKTSGLKLESHCFE